MQKFEPGTIPTDVVRGSAKSLRIANKLTPISTSAREVQQNSADTRAEGNPFAEIDSFATQETKKSENRILEKRVLEQQIKEKNIQEMTAKEHENANNKAQTVILYLVKQVFPESLGFFDRSKQVAQNPEQAKEIAQEDFERLQENPSKILQVALSVIPAKLTELKTKAQEVNDTERSNHLEKVDSILGQIFNVMKQVDGNGSHTSLLHMIESLDQTQIKGDLHQLISEYHKSLGLLGKQIQRANAQLINRTRHPQSELTTGVTTKIDQGLRDSLYTRPESLGAAHRDHLGGIMGSIYDFKDTDWTLGGTPWEYGLNVKGENRVSKTPFPVRRLAGEMRGYIGTLTEEQPGPMFVTTDVEAKMQNI
ncbi:MAG: hypothetical protein RLZZ361_1309 [Cyanobacteriota bacterium]|jgi:hypothetical protein